MANFELAKDGIRGATGKLCRCLVVLRGSEETASSETTSIGTTETPQRSNTDTVANITVCEPSNVMTTLTRVAGEQIVVDKAQKHNIFVKISFLLRLDRCVGPNVNQNVYFTVSSGPTKHCHL